MKNLDVNSVIPTTDPQDPGFDVLVGYVATRDPTASEADVDNNYPFLPMLWQNASSGDDWATYTTNNFWWCANNTTDAQLWWKMVFDVNILSTISDQGWSINTNRAYAQRTSPAFNTAYTPSSTNDTFVIVSLGLVDTLLTPASATVQVNSGGGYVTIATAGLSGVAATETAPISFIVPAGASYKLISVSGSPTITSVYELTQ